MALALTRMSGLLLLLISFGTVAQTETEKNPDPWEGVNRKIYVFNDFLDRNLLLPTARGYRWITPDPLERGFTNAFNNLGELTTIANGLLQAKFGQVASDTGRFAVNSTVGLLGFFDVASGLGMARHDEDFGQTMGYWGVPPGPFVVIPVLGPATVRDGLSSPLDGMTTDVVAQLDDVPTRNSLLAFRLVVNRAELIRTEELISGDRYTFIRDAYLQRRQYLVNDGKVDDNFGDEDYEDWEEW